jgi:hypothetical protein
MKHLRKIFESNEDDKKYIEECFLDVLENPNFEVDDLLEVDLTEKVDYPLSVYKLHIEEGNNIKILAPSGTNAMIGKMKVDLDFLKMKGEKMSELLEDIEVAINRIEEKFPISETQVYINKIGKIDLIVVLKK